MISQIIRDSDMVARATEQEFHVLLSDRLLRRPDAKLEAAMLMAQASATTSRSS